MATILYVFPHPDDESFGPAPVMKSQRDNGHEVYLLTLTRGGATKVRFQLGLTVSEMGMVRYLEMLNVKKVLTLSGMTVLNLPDSRLQELDPRTIEEIIAAHILHVEPDVVVTYAVHGVSGFHDHLVTHAVVKRAFLELKESKAGFLRRLAFLTLPNHTEEPMQKGQFIMKHSDPDLIDCEVPVTPADKEVLKAALSCYETYRETIERSGIVNMIGDRIYFEIYGESFKPPLTDLTESLPS